MVLYHRRSIETLGVALNMPCRVLLGLCVLTAIPHLALGESPVDGPTVELLAGSPGDVSCSVGGASMKCRDIGTYLSETRHLSVTTVVHIRAATTVTFEDAQVLMAALERAGYRSLAFLTPMPRGAATPN